VAQILVVDDERNVRTPVAIILRGDGHEVETVASAEEALALVCDGSFDLVITDLRLEGLDGLELLRSIKRDAPETQVILMTAFGSIEGAVEAMQLGAQSYVRKPFEAEICSPL